MKVKIRNLSIGTCFYTWLIIICCFSTNISINAQTEEPSDTCGTVLLPEQLEYMEETREARNNLRLDSFDEQPPLIPLAIHIVRNSDGIGGLSEEILNAAIDNLNNAFIQKKDNNPNTVPEQIFTFEACFINYIDDDYFFDSEMSPSYSKYDLEYQMAEPNLVDGYINIFFLPNITARGWASLPGFLDLSGKYNPKDWLVIENDDSNTSTLAHEIGHYFNLYHTHQLPTNFLGVLNITQKEEPDGSNCGELAGVGQFAGDGLCDTPADPRLTGCVENDCSYICDTNGYEAYNPDTHNIMSYSMPTCRTFFSPGQIKRMQESLMTDRQYLLEECETQREICIRTDRPALIALFHATSGANWNNAWDLNKEMSYWEGVTLDAKGCVDKIELAARNLNGNLPEEIGDLTDLTSLILNNNNLSGNIPTEIGKLHKLTTLNLRFNSLSGKIPNALQKLRKLQYLMLNNNNLEGDIPEELSRLTSLETIPYLYNNQLSGCFKPFLSELCSKPYSGNAFVSNGNSFDSTWEDFCGTSQSGMCSDGSRMSDSLVLVKLYNSLNGENWLGSLYWSKANPIDCWPGITLNELGRVTEISLGNSQGVNSRYTGNIIPEIGDLIYLENLYLHNFNIYNALPPEIVNLKNLKELSLSKVSETTFPEGIENWVNLETLRILKNDTYEEIPLKIGQLKKLKNLHLEGFEGNLPKELVNISEYFNRILLCNNKLTGCFDPSFISWCSRKNQSISFCLDNGNNFYATFEEFCITNKGVCSETCPYILEDSGTITQGIYEVSNYIRSTGIVGNIQNVTYDAGGYVHLDKGFLADSEQSVVFLAKIEGCTQQLKERSLIEHKALIKNFPNPFTKQTTIEFELEKDTEVSLFVTDITGKRVATLIDHELSTSGINRQVFNGQHLSQGIYYSTLIANGKVSTQKMMLMR